jgi:hypothetical protein
MNPTICTVGKSAPREKWRMTNDEAWGNEMASLQTPWNTVEAMTTAKTFCQQATKRRASDVPSADKVDTSTTSTTYSYEAGGKESPIPGYVIRNLSPSDFLPDRIFLSENSCYQSSFRSPVLGASVSPSSSSTEYSYSSLPPSKDCGRPKGLEVLA